MNQGQQDLRRAAAKAFMESLDQLEVSLSNQKKTSDPQTTPAHHSKPDVKTPPAPLAMTVEELEDAVADIEQFIQNQKSES